MRGELRALRGAGAIGDDAADVAALDAVGELGLGEEQRRGARHGAQLEHRERDLPQRHDVRQHEEDAVAALHALRTKEIRDAVGALPHLLERELPLGAALVHDPQRRPRIAARLLVEEVERPVEGVELRPLEAGVGGGVVVALRKEEVACLEEGAHGDLL
jgi:hypothetical protein